LRCVREKARIVIGVHAGKPVIQRCSRSKVKHREIIRTLMCIDDGVLVTKSKILISTKRYPSGRHLVYVKRISLKGVDAIVISRWLATRRSTFESSALHDGAHR
jgi:hypothetical protein